MDLTFCTPPTTTSNPHSRINPPIPLIPRIHINRQPKLIRIRIHTIRLRRISQLLQNVPGSRAPALRLDADEGGGFVGGLEEVGGFEFGCEVFDD